MDKVKLKKAKELNNQRRQLVDLRDKLLELDIHTLPFAMVKEKQPKNLADPIKWYRGAIDVWNFRRSTIADYLPIYTAVYQELKAKHDLKEKNQQQPTTLFKA